MRQDCGGKAIPFCGDGAKVARIFRVVVKRLTSFPDGGVDAVVSIYKNIFAPNGLKNFFACDQSVPMFGKEEEQLQGDALELDHSAGLAKLEGARVEFEVIELNGIAEHDLGLRGAYCTGSTAGKQYEGRGWLQVIENKVISGSQKLQ